MSQTFEPKPERSQKKPPKPQAPKSRAQFSAQQAVKAYHGSPRVHADPQGSWTGTPVATDDLLPTQDADDL